MTSLYAGPCGCSCSIKASAVPVDCQDFNGGERCEENGPSLTLAVLCKGPPGLADWISVPSRFHHFDALHKFCSSCAQRHRELQQGLPVKLRVSKTSVSDIGIGQVS